MENKSLFAKLIEKLNLARIRSKSCIKKIVPKICAGLLSFSLLFTTGCGCVENNNGNETGGLVDSGGNNNNNNNENNPYKDYSQIMQNVLTSDYYNWLIEEAEKDASFSEMKNNFKGVPFEFLDSEGFDIDRIRNNELDVVSTAISVDNNLYLAVKVETEASKNYYTSYILKYNVTNKELEELKSVFTPLSNTQLKTYYQAAFYIQELDKLKEPEVVSVSYITSEASSSTSSYISKADYLKTGSGNTVAWHMDTEPVKDYYKQTFFLVSSLNFDRFSTLYACNVGIIKIATNYNNTEPIDGLEVYSSTGNVTRLCLKEDIEECQKNIKSGYVYITTSVNCVDFKDELEKTNQN